jgi:hypothetical protein
MAIRLQWAHSLEMRFLMLRQTDFPIQALGTTEGQLELGVLCRTADLARGIEEVLGLIKGPAEPDLMP